MFVNTARHLAAAAVVLALGLGPAVAQQAPQQPAAPAKPQTFTKDHLASAKAAVDSSHMFDTLDQLLLNVTLQVKSTYIKNNPSLGAMIDEVTNKVALELAAKRPDLDHQIQVAWATHFTKAELDDIAKFLASPTGQKWTKELAGVINGSGQAIQAWQKSISDTMMVRVREELLKRGAKL
jgi:hypothetical protein